MTGDASVNARHRSICEQRRGGRSIALRRGTVRPPTLSQSRNDEFHYYATPTGVRQVRSSSGPRRSFVLRSPRSGRIPRFPGDIDQRTGWTHAESSEQERPVTDDHFSFSIER